MSTPPPPEVERKQGRGTAWVFIEMLCAFLAVSGVNMKLTDGRAKKERLTHYNKTFVVAQVPVIVEKPLVVCGCRKFQVDGLGDHLCTCTAHSGAKKAHDWSVDQLADLFRTNHKVKTQQVVKNRGHHCVDIELAGYLANVVGPVPLVLDLRVAHDRVGSSTDPV
jgi:hypothetical protein